MARLSRWRPNATANSQPIAGLMPWKAPSPASASHGQDALTAAADPSAAAHSALGRTPASL